MSSVFQSVYDKMNPGDQLGDVELDLVPDMDEDEASFIFEEELNEDGSVIDINETGPVDMELEDDSRGTSKKRKKDMKGRKRLLTVNFKNLKIIDATDTKALTLWKAQMYENGAKEIVYDRRNYIYCAAPTGDFKMLQNYYELLNSLSMQWVNYDLFDQGYLPYIYWPSFRVDREGINDLLIKAAAEADCEIMEIHGTSLFTKSKIAGLREFWIHREQLLKLMDWLESNIPGLNFGQRDINTVSMAKFAEAFAKLG